jgi:hypothetical protein
LDVDLFLLSQKTREFFTLHYEKANQQTKTQEIPARTTLCGKIASKIWNVFSSKEFHNKRLSW